MAHKQRDFTLTLGIPSEHIDENMAEAIKAFGRELWEDGFKGPKITRGEFGALFKFTHPTRYGFDIILEKALLLPEILGASKPYYFSLYWDNAKDIKSGVLDIEVTYPLIEIKRRYKENVGGYKANITEIMELYLNEEYNEDEGEGESEGKENEED
jgi:hypothetical protein